jgi:hypothetical protein
MAVMVIALKQIIPWMFTIPVGGAIFFAVAFATRSFTLDHVRRFRSMLGRSKYAESPPSNA